MRALLARSIACGLLLGLAATAMAQNDGAVWTTDGPAKPAGLDELARYRRMRDAFGPELAAQLSGVDLVSYRCPHCKRGPNSCTCTITPDDMKSKAQTTPDADSAQQPSQSTPRSNTNSLSSTYGAARGPAAAAPYMLGDFTTGGSFGGAQFLASDSSSSNFVPFSAASAPVAIASHTIKIADNESPLPQNRFIFTSNYFEHVGDKTSIMRQTLGFERPMGDGNTSFGVRLPYYTVVPGTQQNVSAPANLMGTFGVSANTTSNFGDLTMVFKRAVRRNAYGDVFTLGAALVAPIGPTAIGGVQPLFNVDGVTHSGGIQPYMGFFRWFDTSRSGWFAHGFTSLDQSFNVRDATFLFNDYGLGYLVQRNQRSGLTGWAPTVELHINTPLGARTHNVTPSAALTAETGINTITGNVTYAEQVNLTTGISYIFNRRTTMAIGAVVPLENPKPFNFELQFQLSTSLRAMFSQLQR